MVEKITDTELIGLEKRIKKYLLSYKKLVGPLQIMKSRVGLKLTKFHCLLKNS